MQEISKQLPQISAIQNPILPVSKVSNFQSFKWLIVLLNSTILFGCTYSVQDLSTQQNNYKMAFSSVKNFEFYFNLMYMSSFMLLIAINLFMSKLVDKYRPGLFILIPALIAMSGQFFILVSVRFQVFELMFLGRFFINMAVTPLLMANGKLMAQLFDKNRLATANSICLTLNLMGTFINLRFSGVISENYGFLMSGIFALGLNIFGCCLGIIVCMIDYKFGTIINSSNKITNNNKNFVNQEQEQQKQLKLQQNQQLKNKWRYFLKNMTLPFALFAFSQGTLNIVANIVEIIGPKFLTDHYNMSTVEAGQYMSFIPLTTFLMPLFSQLIDIFGQPLLWLIPSALIGACSIFGIIFGNPLINMLLFGVAFSLRWVSIFPGIEELVDRESSAKAFGFIRVQRDILGVFLSFMNGYLYQQYESYVPSMFMVVGLQLIALVSVLLCYKLHLKEQQELIEQQKQMEKSIMDIEFQQQYDAKMKQCDIESTNSIQTTDSLK